MAHPHAKLIEKLGGSVSVAQMLGISTNMTWNWTHRGVSWQYRAEFANLLTRAGVAVPAGFLTPKRGAA